jgi:hypothetical protein
VRWHKPAEANAGTSRFNKVIHSKERDAETINNNTGTVSDHRLDDQVRSPADVKNCSSILCVQTSYGAHPASYPMGTVGPFARGKARPGRDAEHSPASSAEVKDV